MKNQNSAYLQAVTANATAASWNEQTKNLLWLFSISTYQRLELVEMSHAIAACWAELSRAELLFLFSF